MSSITFFLPTLSSSSGGAEHISLRLMSGFIKRGIEVNLILASYTDSLHRDIPPGVKIIQLNCKRTSYSIFKLARYISKNKPKNILSHLHRANRILLLAKIISFSKTRVHIVEHNTVSVELRGLSLVNKIFARLSYTFLYKRAATIIHVSRSAAKDLQKILPGTAPIVNTIYNPVISEEILKVNSFDSPHSWFDCQNTPVILGAGRLTEQKNMLNLIEAFSIVNKHKDARLIILGEGEQEQRLIEIVKKLNLQSNVLLRGYVDNPLEYMRRASVFVLSSNFEALPTVLIEAMACGCPVVSTDCPSGPAEILQDGKYGELVPLDDPNALANAIVRTIQNPPNSNMLKEHAMFFSIERSVSRYIEILELNYNPQTTIGNRFVF